jgi:carotenoid cleavage dioxygenase-like enzyme
MGDLQVPINPLCTQCFMYGRDVVQSNISTPRFTKAHIFCVCEEYTVFILSPLTHTCLYKWPKKIKKEKTETREENEKS